MRLRAHVGPEGRVRIHARNLSLEAEGRTSWADAAERPSALDYLLAALAADLLAGLGHESRRGGPEVHDAELRLQAWLEHPLAVAGVVGETGSPRLAAIHGSLYLGTGAPEAEARDLWGRVLRGAPVHASLSPGVQLDIELKLVP